MLYTSEKSFAETKKIKGGKKFIEKKYDSFIDWLGKVYEKPINIFCDTFTSNNILFSRIEIILEYEKDLFKYKIDHMNQYNIGGNLKKKIITQFNQLVDEPIFKEFYEDKEYNFLKNTVLNISTFETIAKIETIEKITQKEIDQLFKDINNFDLWTIKRLLSFTTFFVYTEKQLNKYRKDSKTLKEWNDKYLKIVKKYDKYNYFNKSYLIILDSKENFDKNYESNWYYYYRN